MVVVLLILQIILVTGRVIEGKLREVMESDLGVVLRALKRSHPSRLRGYERETDVVRFLYRDMDAARRMMEGFDELDFSGMGLGRLPVYGMLLLTNLRSLVLDRNPELGISQGDIEMISRLPIEAVSMSSSNMSVETFRALQGLPRLCRLNISGNESLSGYTDSNRFGDLATRLVELDVSECYLGSDWLDEILQCTNLKSLDVSGNVQLFRRRGPGGVCSLMGSLVSLNVSGCDLDYDWLGVILECRGLAVLDVSRNTRLFNSRGPGGFLMDSLSRLNVSRCRLRGEWVDRVLRCAGLVELDISGNRNIGVNHASFRKLVSLKSLRRLKAGRCDLTAKSLSEIFRCEGLLELDVEDNELVWRGKVEFGGSKGRLVRLNVAGTEASGDVLGAICGLPKRGWRLLSRFGTCDESGFTKLAVLDISRNAALGRVMSQDDFRFGSLESTVVELNISLTRSRGCRAVEAAGRCERLRRLGVSYNTDLWSGADGVDLGYLKSRLQVLDVAGTRLPPGVLREILGFKQLEQLDISGNDTARQAVGSGEVRLGGVRDTLRVMAARDMGLAGEGLRWILEEFRGLEYVDVGDNEEITAADLMGLDFETLQDRLVEFYVTADRRTAADLRKRLPLTGVYTTNRS